MLRSFVLLAAFAQGVFAQDVRVSVFGLFRPSHLQVRSAGTLIEVSRAAVEDVEWHRLKAGDTVAGRGGVRVGFRLRIPGKIERDYYGTLLIESESGHLRAVVTMPVETAVASIVAAESVPGVGFEALKAQAVAVRSFLLASLKRHVSFDACDTTHCQFLRNPPAAGSPAEQATRKTEGQVITFEGRVVQALYSARCGGRTRTLAEAGWQVGPYPFFAVECKTCRGKRVEGHRLGLCERGAAAMAGSGAKYDAILRYYFPGTVIGERRRKRGSACLRARLCENAR